MFFSRKYTFGAMALVGILLLYAAFNPAHENWFPKCPFHQLTHWKCMLCGTQRATHELLHGHISASFAQNQWLWITAPYWVGLIGVPLLPAAWQNTSIATRLRHWATHPYTSWGVGILTVIFMLWRNLAL